MKVLIVIDVQNDFVTGALGTPEAIKIIPNVKKKIKEYTDAGYRVIFTRDTHDVDYLITNEGKHLPVEHCIFGTEGWDIVDGVDIPEYENVEYINKTTFGFTKWFNNKFKDDDEIEIVGLCTDICVVSNALIIKSLFPNLDIKVDASCCAGVTPQTHKSALETMRMCQIEIVGE